MATDPRMIEKIRIRWQEAGAAPCERHQIEREYGPGVGYDDFYCAVCGEAAPTREALQSSAERL